MFLVSESTRNYDFHSSVRQGYLSVAGSKAVQHPATEENGIRNVSGGGCLLCKRDLRVFDGASAPEYHICDMANTPDHNFNSS